MTRAEAKRRVCAGAAQLLADEGGNQWIWTDEQGRELPPIDLARMRDALRELSEQLRRRSEGNVRARG